MVWLLLNLKQAISNLARNFNSGFIYLYHKCTYLTKAAQIIFFFQVQEKVFEEIDSEIGDDQVTANHRPKLPYTEATLFEIWRCGPVGPIGDLNFLI